MQKAEIQKFLKELQDKVGSTRETLVNAVQHQLLKMQTPLRKGEYIFTDGDPLGNVNSELLAIADDLYLTSALLEVAPQSLRLWRKHESAVSELRKAMDTVEAGGGTEWIPTGFSRELIDRLRLDMKVAALHKRITMPTNPFKMPVLSADPTAYLVAESSSDEAPKFKASQATTANFQFNAKKFAVRVIFSEELTEDSIVPLLPHLKDLVVKAIRAAEEKGIIDGDTATTHQDSDVTDSRDARKAFDGYRKKTLTAAKKDLSTFTTTTVRGIREAMTNTYAANPNQLAFITSTRGYLKLVDLTETRTVDKYGPNATILTGELGKLDGSPIIVSEYVRDDLNASGVYDGVTTSKGMLHLVNVDAFLIGDRRKVTVKVWTDPRTDQQELIISERVDFTTPYNLAVDKAVGFGYNF